MSDTPIKGVGETCPCGKAFFNRVERNTGRLLLHYDICPACGFETYAPNTMAVKKAMWLTWKQEKEKMTPTIHNVFDKQLALIRSDAIRDFVTDTFQALCPNYFWYIPASVRGHHPPICRSQGGLVHHVKLAVAFADSLLDMENETEGVIHDQVIAGVLLHDMLKRGPVEDELKTWATHREANTNHGRFCADQIVGNIQVCSLSTLYPPIIRAVELHMGRWTADLTTAEKQLLKDCDVTRLVHAADYCASRALHKFLAERALDKTMGYIND